MMLSDSLKDRTIINYKAKPFLIFILNLIGVIVVELDTVKKRRGKQMSLGYEGGCG